MAHPSKIKIGIIDSVKVDNYQYKKPSIEVEIELNPGDNFVDALDKGKDKIEKAMKKWKQELIDNNKAPTSDEMPY